MMQMAVRTLATPRACDHQYCFHAAVRDAGAFLDFRRVVSQIFSFSIVRCTIQGTEVIQYGRGGVLPGRLRGSDGGLSQGGITEAYRRDGNYAFPGFHRCRYDLIVPPRPRRTVAELSKELMFAWEHTRSRAIC